MAVMHVRDVRMAVTHRLMTVGVAVRTLGHHIVVVVVVAIVMAMGVFVLQRLVLMLVVVRLGQVQGHAGQHQQSAQRHAPAR